MIIIIDNYDSFTYNLVDLVKRFAEVRVFRNDEVTSEEVLAFEPQGVVISPGPGRPENSRTSIDFVEKYASEVPILGVCLGHQIIGEVMGAKLVHASYPMHGKTSEIHHADSSLFEGLPNPLEIMRYHSLILEKNSFPGSMKITAETSDGEIMGLQHLEYALSGVQFHPESILSECGEQMIRNWINSFSEKEM